MKIIFYIMSLFLLFNVNSYAQEVEIIQPKSLDEVCKTLYRHQVDADVKYQPGIDARGNSVVSADLNDNRLEIPRTFSIPLQVEQLDALNIDADSILNPELAVGEVVIDLDSDTISFNGQDITRSDFEVLCLQPDEIQPKPTVDVEENVQEN